MKKIKSNLAMILALMVFLTSFGFIGAFAEGETEVGGADVAEAMSKPDAPTDFVIHGGAKAVHLSWKASSGAEGYRVYDKNGKLIKDKLKSTTLKVETSKTSGTYSVSAYNSAGESEKATAKYTAKNGPVRAIAYKLKIKKSGTLKSHGGPKAKYKVKRGQTIKADGFGGGGKYMFVHNGSTFYVAALRIGSKKAEYTKKFNYTKETALNYVNDKGITSKTKYLVWVNTYTQHIYMFKGTGKRGGWKEIVFDDECSTGKASTPTPTGISHKKKIYKHIRRRHSIPWWSSFSQINSIHGKKGGWKMGSPKSNGCVRNWIPNAKTVYKKAPLKTTVYIY